MLVNISRTTPLAYQEHISGSSSSSEDLHMPEITLRNRDLFIVKTLCESRFPVYIVTSKRADKFYAMKVFPWENMAPSLFYLQEVRFANFNHRNIISMPYYETEATFTHGNRDITASYILMEYAHFGDFYGALTKYKVPFHDKLLRTYVHQLIEGLEYMHSQGAAHLDIKPENLLIADDYTLKIADFDLSYIHDDGDVATKGTKNFRAPEIFNQICNNPQAADIYSAGIVMFFLKTRGTLPYAEDKLMKGIDMVVLKETDPEMFWEYHCKFGDKHPSFFSEDFKALFTSMVKFNPEERASITQIKESSWYKGEAYTNEELADFMNGRFDMSYE